MSLDPLALYEQARGREDAAAGFYNHNIRLDTDDGDVIVRIPIPRAATMDLTIWAEADVLAALGPYLDPIPHVRHVNTEPAFQIHDFVHGQVVDAFAPRGARLPGRILTDIIAFFGGLLAVPVAALPAPPAGWPPDGDTAAFAHRLSDVTATVHATYRDTYGRLFTDFGIPDDPLAPVLAHWPELAPRPFRLVHADIHRKNLIDTGQRTVFLDWELALLGDPLYDLAVHLHKMAYQPDEHDTLVRGWLATAPADCSANWAADLDRYLTHERIKSAIVDSVRYTTLITSGRLTAVERQVLLGKLAGKLNAAHRSWGTDRADTSTDVEKIIQVRYG